MINKTKYLILAFLLSVSFLANAQKKKEKDTDLPKGNDAFLEKKYADAEADYRISDSKNRKQATPSYNLGNAIYRQNQSTEAQFHYRQALKNAKTRTEKHKAFHNLGNTYMNAKDYGNAVEAYKNALRNNPADEETRYNYALAKKYLKDNPPKKDGDKNKDDSQNKKEDKNKDKDNEKKDGKDKEKDKKDGDKDQKDQKDKNGQPKPNPGGIPKQRVNNLLEAVQNEEKKVQDKVNKQKVQLAPKKTDKDW